MTVTDKLIYDVEVLAANCEVCLWSEANNIQNLFASCDSAARGRKTKKRRMRGCSYQKLHVISQRVQLFSAVETEHNPSKSMLGFTSLSLFFLHADMLSIRRHMFPV